MKKLSFLLLALAFALPVSAQSVNAEYDRNALTVISVHHNDSYDAITDAYLRQNFPGGQKFDDNTVETRYITVRYPRFEEREGADAKAFMNQHRADIYEAIQKEDVARQVIGKWFNRTPGGLMDLSLINKRADYNATDQTYNIASAQALGEYLLHGEGVKLVDNSYILVVDHSVPVRRESRNNTNGKITNINYSTHAIGYLYKVSFGDVQRKAVYEQWLYPTDDEATKQVKRENWNKIQFPLSGIDNVETLSSAGFDPNSRYGNENEAKNQAIRGCAPAIMDKLEKHVEAWKVKTTIYKTHPIVSKVGTKEGLRNMSRFEVREYVLDNDGNVGSRRKGFVRATTIANNTSVSRGKSPVSQFYQIAGTKLEPGMLLKEKKSLNLDVKALYYGGASKGFGAEADYMFGMSNRGFCSHIRLGFTYFPYKAGLQGPADETGTFYYLKEQVSSADIRLGYGYGIRPFRQMEIIPGAYALFNYLDSKITRSESELESEQSAMKKMGYGLEVGADINVTVFYPVKINAGAFYSLPFFGGEYWKAYTEILERVGEKRLGFTYRVGLVYEF